MNPGLSAGEGLKLVVKTLLIQLHVIEDNRLAHEIILPPNSISSASLQHPGRLVRFIMSGGGGGLAMVIRGRLLQRYTILIILVLCLGGSFFAWRSFVKTSSHVPTFPSSLVSESGMIDASQVAHAISKATQKVLLLPEETIKGIPEDDGFIPVPADGVVPEGSSIKIDMSSGASSFKPPSQRHQGTNGNDDYVEMKALQQSREQANGDGAKEPAKWRQQRRGVSKQVEDLLIGLYEEASADATKAMIEKLEDYCISSMSNAEGIFNSTYFINLVNCLKHQDVSVRIAAVNFLFFAIQNNHAPSEAFLMNTKALSVVSKVFDSEKDPTVLYKFISIIESSLAVCAESERFRILAANLKENDLFAKMTTALPQTTNMAAPEKVVAALALIVQLTEDESCLLHLEQAVNSANSLPRLLVAKKISLICPLIHSRRHPRLYSACQSL